MLAMGRRSGVKNRNIAVVGQENINNTCSKKNNLGLCLKAHATFSINSPLHNAPHGVGTHIVPYAFRARLCRQNVSALHGPSL